MFIRNCEIFSLDDFYYNIFFVVSPRPATERASIKYCEKILVRNLIICHSDPAELREKNLLYVYFILIMGQIKRQIINFIRSKILFQKKQKKVVENLTQSSWKMHNIFHWTKVQIRINIIYFIAYQLWFKTKYKKVVENLTNKTFFRII